MTLVKICGLTSAADAIDAAQVGADWLGLNFYRNSRRCVSFEAAREIVDAVRGEAPKVALVGVFVNAPETTVARMQSELELDYLQFHGDESPGQCAVWGARAIKALGLASAADIERFESFPCPTVLCDTPSSDYGGSGTVGDWALASLLRQRSKKRVLLAGGLTAENVGAAVSQVGPFGVDVASGVESTPGKKDRGKMRRFVEAVRGAS